MNTTPSIDHTMSPLSINATVDTLMSVTSDIVKKDTKYLYRGLARYLLVWYVPLVFIVGTLGAAFCLFFLFMSKLFNRNILIWMVSICVADLMILNVDGLRMLLKVLAKYDIRDENTFLCKTHNYFSNFFFYWSAYMQACMSLQRLFFVLQPLKARVILRFNRILIAWSVVTFMCFLPHIPYLIFWEVQTDNGDCEPNNKWYYYVTTVCDLVIWGIIPLVIMTLSTIMISTKIFAFNVDSSNGNSSHLNRKKKSLTPDDENHIAINKNAAAVKGKQCGQRHGGSDNASHVTRLLVTLNVFYMLTTYPLLIYLMHLNFGLKNQVGVTIPQPVHKFYYYLFRSLCYMNSSCNWFFYCAAGKVFRKRAWIVLNRIFCRKRTHIQQQNEGTELDTRLVSNQDLAHINRSSKQQNYIRNIQS